MLECRVPILDGTRFNRRSIFKVCFARHLPLSSRAMHAGFVFIHTLHVDYRRIYAVCFLLLLKYAHDVYISSLSSLRRAIHSGLLLGMGKHVPCLFQLYIPYKKARNLLMLLIVCTQNRLLFSPNVRWRCVAQPQHSVASFASNPVYQQNTMDGNRCWQQKMKHMKIEYLISRIKRRKIVHTRLHI